MSVFHGPSAAEFYAQLDEPGYQAVDRLVVRDGPAIAAHLRLARQTIQLDSLALPAARFMDLATAEEFRGRGLATALLAAGERMAAERGILVGLTRTRAGRLFARQGWSVCGRHTFSTAAPRAVLAELGATSATHVSGPEAPSAGILTPLPQPLFVRPLRRIELPAAVRLYEQNLRGRYGWPIRSEEYWEWLLARGACDRLYIAATGPESMDLASLADSVVGYACVRQGRIVELVTAPSRDDVARHLLARVCADASEQNSWQVRCDLPPEHPLHAVLRAAGGDLTDRLEQGGEIFMARLFDPLAVLRRLAPILAARAARAKLDRPAELGVDLGDGRRGRAGVVDRYRLLLGRRQTRIETGGPSRHAVSLAAGELAPLVLGSRGADDMMKAGSMIASSSQARLLAATLFPASGWWRPPLDDLLA